MFALNFDTSRGDPHAPARSLAQLWPLMLDAAHGDEDTPAAPGGLQWSRDEGWILVGAWTDEACTAFELFKPLLDARGRDANWVLAQLGQSLDACVATRSGESMFINGPENIVHLHRLRALCDAVMVGVGTVVADNPRLTTRRVSGPNPVRVLLDPRAALADRVPVAHVFNDGEAPTLWLVGARRRVIAESLVGESACLAVANLLRSDGQPDIARAVEALRTRGLRRVFIEGGGVTVSRALAQGCLDRLHLAVAPVIIGDGRPGLRFTGAERLADCPRPRHRVFAMGVDQLWDLEMRPVSPEGSTADRCAPHASVSESPPHGGEPPKH